MLSKSGEWKKKLKAKATVRFETAPGKQLQIDFGQTLVRIGEKKVRVFLFVATLGYSRRVFVRPFLHERQTAWLLGIEEAFRHFEGIPEELLVDNAKALVNKHDVQTSTVVFNEKFKAFADYWAFKPRACRPYRARTKGKDERMVGYVKRNAIAGHTFSHWEALEEHLQSWMVNIADQRIHATTGEPPAQRFLRDEKCALRPTAKPSFIQIRELQRKVHADASVELDTNHYSVPAKYIGEQVLLELSDGTLRVFHQEIEIATHILSLGKRERHTKPEHLSEIFRKSRASVDDEVTGKNSELTRSLSEYQMVAGGGW